ncbi:MAG: dihydroorotate dehydrogenase electron transfer subunit [Magnetococcales bacterium]|nr:dihydroorotate dehydrogenase electron transfer subunit [Magnetococcales bacterium]
MCGPKRPRIHHRQALVLHHRALPDRQHLLRLHAPWIAATAAPGQFVHVLCDPGLTLPRPFSILDADPVAGSLDLLYRVVGLGTAAMAAWPEAKMIPLAGPSGQPFSPIDAGQPVLLLAGGVGLAPLDFFARRASAQGARVTLLLGTESTPPFALVTSRFSLPGVPDAVYLALAHLEHSGVASRLATLRSTPGYFPGYVTDLAEALLRDMNPALRAHLRVLACGPPAMLLATARLAERFALAGEVSLEAHMACGFGGCAGCAVPMLGQGDATVTERTTEDEEEKASWHYQRACVDGPVFDVKKVAWSQMAQQM